MKKILSLLLIIVPFTLCAQKGKLSVEKRKEFEAQKIAFFTQQMDLTPEEAAVFWPLYNEMKIKQRQLTLALRKNFKKFSNQENVSEVEYVESITSMLNCEGQLHDIKKDYYKRMLKVIPASKLWKMSVAEIRFQQRLISRLHGPGKIEK